MNALRRELARVIASPLLLALWFVFPLLGALLLFGVLSRGVPSDLPVAVVDLDASGASARLVRMLDANQSIRVVRASPRDARDLVWRGEAHAIVTIPRGFARELQRSEAPGVVAQYNAQMPIAGNLLRRALTSVVSTFSAGVELRQRRARGESEAAAIAQVEAIRADAHPLFNRELSSATSLLPALFATMILIVGTISGVWAVGEELRDGTAAEWLASARDSTATAIFAKLAIHASWFALLGIACVLVLYGAMAIPIDGSRFAAVIAGALLGISSVAIGIAIAAVTANLRFACSVAAFYTAPAFALAGVSFPVYAMPPFARGWSALLPLRHFVVAMERVTHGVPAASALVASCALAIVSLAVAWMRLRIVLRQERYWRRS
jgi:ABC-2 type transport system permease protein